MTKEEILKITKNLGFTKPNNRGMLMTENSVIDIEDLILYTEALENSKDERIEELENCLKKIACLFDKDAHKKPLVIPEIYNKIIWGVHGLL